jgi:drug/metabolite transporter (DMT)-like permease
LAYDGGSNTLTVITARSFLTVVLTWLLMVVIGESRRVNSRSATICAATGICYALHLYGFLGAVAFIPVAMTILIFFTHPLLVALAASLSGDDHVPGTLFGQLLVGFLGLVLAIGFSVQGLDLTGIGLAALAAVAAVVVILGNGRAMARASSLAVVLYMMLSAAITLGLLFPFFGSFALPATATGWLGFAGVAIGSTVGTLAFFCAVPILGTVRATMISNLEPLLGILFAMLIVGERLSLLQYAGIAMVLGSIVTMNMGGQARRSADSEPR